ncbi:ESX secretion-associated protein EspG [Lentzea sp. NPDC060358]|uniref:ESX secretion-associated protein EspG n=1 Tax=Lentzea sp. NPDC060358 TaxID=3347103 RepID=UPI003655A132
MTVYSFSLSHAAADVLWEDLGLGSRPYPFDFPRFGQSDDERRSIRNAVYRDLGDRGLVRRGRVVGEVEEALTLLVRFEFGVNAIAMVDPGRDVPLLARGGAAGEQAALAVLEDRVMEVGLVSASQLVRSVVDLVPDERPGPGQSVSVPRPVEEQPERGRDEDFQSSYLSSVRTWSPASSQTRALEAISRRPRSRVGQFGVVAGNRGGRELRAPQIAWFDTDQGRYLTQKRKGADGRDWLVQAPADNARIAAQLASELSVLRG